MNDSFQSYSDNNNDFSFREVTLRDLYLGAIAKGMTKEGAFEAAIQNADYLLEKLFENTQKNEG